MKELLLKKLQASVTYAEKEGEDMDAVSWGMQEGVLISYNDAKIIVSALQKEMKCQP
jgi:hypothetical protein